MNVDETLFAGFRPGRSLLLRIVVATFVVWWLADVDLEAAVQAQTAESELLEAAAVGDWATAAEAGQRRIAMETAPPVLELWFLTTEALGRAGRPREALQVAEDALTLATERLGEDDGLTRTARNNLAWTIVNLPDVGLGDLAQARAVAAPALEAEPDNPYFLGTLGTIALRSGDLDGARDLLEKAVERHAHPTARATDLAILAIVHARLGSLARAAELVEKARLAGTPEPRYLREAESLLAPPDTPKDKTTDPTER